MSAILGIDLGDRSIGVALGDPGSGLVAPLVTLRRGTPQRDAARIGRICRERGVETIVVGLPLHLDGRESPQSERTRAWAQELSALLDLPISLRDERLSSQVASARMSRPPRGRAGGPPSPAALRGWRAKLDREAAAAIVQAELDARVASDEGSAPS